MGITKSNRKPLNLGNLSINSCGTFAPFGLIISKTVLGVKHFSKTFRSKRFCSADVYRVSQISAKTLGYYVWHGETNECIFDALRCGSVKRNRETMSKHS